MREWLSAESYLRRHIDDDVELELEEEADKEDLREALKKYLEYLTPEWHKKAACVGMDDSIFFGNKDIDVRPALTVSEIKRAKAICIGCEAILDCFTHAIETRERYGIWAGTSGRTRSRIFALIDSGKTTEQKIIQEFIDGKIDKFEKVKTSIVEQDEE